jgi:hypothetical protein
MYLHGLFCLHNDVLRACDEAVLLLLLEPSAQPAKHTAAPTCGLWWAQPLR